MSGRGVDAVTLRVSALAAVALVALVSATSWSLGPLGELGSPERAARREGMTLEVTGHRRGKSTPLADVLPVGDVELRFSGNVPRPCHVSVVVMTPRRVDVMGDRGGEAIGVRAGPGPFKIPGGRVVDVVPGEPVRFVAICGPSTLAAETLRVAAWSAQQAAAGNVAAAPPLEELPEGTLQVSRVLTATAY